MPKAMCLTNSDEKIEGREGMWKEQEEGKD